MKKEMKKESPKQCKPSQKTMKMLDIARDKRKTLKGEKKWGKEKTKNIRKVKQRQ